VFLRELTKPVRGVPGVGEKTAKTLERLGITNIGELLSHFPRAYEDRTVPVPLRAWNTGRPVCTEARVIAHDWGGFGAKRFLKVHIEDESGRAVLVCFNRQFLEKQLVHGEWYHIYGNFAYKYGCVQSTDFEFEHIDSEKEKALSGFASILPVYPLTAGITQGALRRVIEAALRLYCTPLEDELPSDVREKHGLLSTAEAVRSMHFPASMEVQRIAQKTLVFTSLFYLEVMVAQRAAVRKGGVGGVGKRWEVGSGKWKVGNREQGTGSREQVGSWKCEVGSGHERDAEAERTTGIYHESQQDFHAETIPTSRYQLPTSSSHSKLQTPNSKLQTQLQTPNSKLQTPNSKLQTPNSKLPTPNSQLQTTITSY